MINISGNINRNFKGQQDNELVHTFCRKHWITIVKDVLGFFIFLGVMFLGILNYKGIVGFFRSDSSFFTITALVLILVGAIYVHLFFLRMINYFLSIIVFTNIRIVEVDKSLYLRNSKDAIDLSKIQDINKTQHGVFQNFLKYGDLKITLSGTSMTKTLTLVPNPDYHFRKINTIKGALLSSRYEYRQRKPKKEESQPKQQANQTYDMQSAELMHHNYSRHDGDN